MHKSPIVGFRIVTVTSPLPDVAAPTTLTLGDLMSLSGLRPMPGPTVDPHTEILGGASVERPDAADQVETGWVAICEGSGFVGPQMTEPVQRDFVRALAHRSASALVIRLGRVWDHVPPAIGDECSHQGLPLLTMPSDSTPAALLRTIHDASGNQDYAILGRALSVQTELIDALTFPDVERELINRLSTRLGVSAILYDQRVEVLASQGDAPIHLIKDHIDLASDSERRTTIGRWQVSISPLSVPTGVYWLALGWSESHELTREIVRSTSFALQKLLTAHITTDAVTRRQDQVQRARLLVELLEGPTGTRLASLRDQLVLLQFPREGPYLAHLVRRRPTDQHLRPTTPSDGAPDHIIAMIQDLAESREISVLMADREDDYVILLPRQQAFIRGLVAALPDAEHGTSSVFADLGEARTAVRQAEMSLLTSERRGQLTPFDEAGFINFILAQVPAETLREKAQEVLVGLPEGGLVEQTILEYLRNSMDVRATARAMHLHPNSIRYRLSKAEDMLGRRLTDPETITLLYLTLHDRFVRASRTER